MIVCEFDLTGPYAYDPNVQTLWSWDIADAQAPTEDEVLAAVNLLDDYDLTDIVGWEVETEIITSPPWGSFETQRVGGQRIARSDLIFAADRDGDDIRILLQRRDLGFVLILPSGPYVDHPNAPLNVYPVEVAQISQQQRLRTGGGSLLTVQFAIRAVVGENVMVVIGS